MGLLQEELKELAVLRKRVQAGTIRPEIAMLELAVFSQSEKRVKLMLTALIAGAKYGKVLGSQIKRTNLLSEGSVTIMKDLEIEQITCEETKDPVTRQECLDRSGEADSTCNACETGRITKNILCGT